MKLKPSQRLAIKMRELRLSREASIELIRWLTDRPNLESRNELDETEIPYVMGLLEAMRLARNRYVNATMDAPQPQPPQRQVL